jgi:hypothetical protein
MNKRYMIFTCGLVMLLTSCVVTSLHPYYATKDVGYEPRLLGQWTNTQQADERWKFEREGQDAYRLTYVTDDGTNVTQAHFFKLGGQNFLDLAGVDQKWEVLPPPIPSHLLLRVLQLSPTVRLAPLSHDWLLTFLEKDPKAVRHELIGDKTKEPRVVLTDETKELQAFIVGHLKTDEAWKDAFELRRDEAREPAK